MYRFASNKYVHVLSEIVSNLLQNTLQIDHGSFHYIQLATYIDFKIITAESIVKLCIRGWIDVTELTVQNKICYEMDPPDGPQWLSYSN